MYRKGDRVRVTHTKGNGDKIIHEFTITQDGPEPRGDGVDMDRSGPWSIEVLEKAPVPEPQGFGALVEFEDRLNGLRTLAVRSTGGAWYDIDGYNWSWTVISEGAPRVLNEGVES